MDGSRGALLPLATGSCLRAPKTELGAVSYLGGTVKVPTEVLGWRLPSGGSGPSGLLTDEHPA
jgi:hypothetical protein